MADLDISLALSRVTKPKKLSILRGIPKRNTLTGTTYFYLIENRDDDGIVNVKGLIHLLNEKKGLVGDYALTTGRLVHRKMDVLKQKHGMFIEKHGKEPYVYRVKPITESQAQPGTYEQRLLAMFKTYAGLALSGEVDMDQAAEDFMESVKGELRVGPR